MTPYFFLKKKGPKALQNYKYHWAKLTIRARFWADWANKYLLSIKVHTKNMKHTTTKTNGE